MIIRNYEIGGLNGGLKAQKQLAQGIALGQVSELFALQGQKLQYEVMLLPLQGEITNCHLPRAMP